MKMYDKKDLKFKNGLIVTAENDVVGISSLIPNLANELETKLQQARYLASQPEACAAPSLADFERKSSLNIEKFECETPIQDKRAEEAVAFMDELDKCADTARMNTMLENIKELVLFAKEGEIISSEDAYVVRFDTPCMGNPLDWDEDFIMSVVAEIHGCTTETSEVEVVIEDGE